MPDYRLGLLVVIFFSTRYVAVASIGFGVSLPVCCIVSFWFSESSSGQMGKIFLAFLVMGWIVWRHRENLARLKAGTENRFEKNRNPKINLSPCYE